MHITLNKKKSNIKDPKVETRFFTRSQSKETVGRLPNEEQTLAFQSYLLRWFGVLDMFGFGVQSYLLTGRLETLGKSPTFDGSKLANRQPTL